MKIKNQLNLLIIAIVFMPVMVMICLPLYHYLTSPQLYLMKDYEQLRRLNEIEMSESEWIMLKDKLENLPHNFQTAVYYNGKIVISNFPDLKSGTELTFNELFNYISETSSKYDYQLQSHFGSRNVDDSDHYKRLNKPIVLNRARNTVQANKSPLKYFYIPFFSFVTIFEIIIILYIIRVSSNITHSISYLEKACQKISDGELDTVIEKPKNQKHKNEITSLSENLDKMRASIKDSHQRKTKFIMGISHDLRTPVAVIKGYCEAITDGIVTDPEQIKNSVSIVHTKADQLESMINDLIDYAKMNNSEWLKVLKPTEIKPIITEAVQNATITAEVYKRTINSTIEIEDEVTVPMDKALVSRAFENIVSNAFRYSKEGDSITISAKQNDNMLEVSISDTGRGMSEEDKEHLFDLFYRGTSSRREQGCGIGLSVVKTIIDSHNWTIDVESEIDKGSTFTIHIPC